MPVSQRAMVTLPTLMRALRKEYPKLPNPPLPSRRRAFSLYDQINLIDNVPDDQLRFQGPSLVDPEQNMFIEFQQWFDILILKKFRYTTTGFKVNGVEYEGGVFCIGNLLMSWSPKKFSEITPDSLSIFQVVRPIPGENPNEILILGCGRHVEPVDPELRHFIKSTGMKLEAIDLRNPAHLYLFVG